MEKTIKREIEDDVVRWLEAREILAIRGARQSGKTTFLGRITEILLEKKIDKKQIHFITFEDDIEKEKFEANPLDYISYFIGDGKEKHFFLLDEVQYIKSAGKLLKLLYDKLENIKIIVTGSSTLDISDVGSYLVGRVLFFELYPFSFGEFLKAKDEKMASYYLKKKINLEKPNIKQGDAVFLDELNKYLKEYLTFGGYPAIVLEKNAEKKRFLLKNLFLTYVEKDVVKVYGSKYKQRISDLIKHLASTNGGLVNYNEISGLTGLYSKELKEILSILEDTYIIKSIKPFHKNLATELKKNPKIYFEDTGLRNFMTGRFEFSQEEFGKLLENYILGKLRHRKTNYWRTTAKAEVDFVFDEKTPIEVKIHPKITRSLRSFLAAYEPQMAFLANMNSLGEMKIGKTSLFMVPFALF